jgi:hypothetical protein
VRRIYDLGRMLLDKWRDALPEDPPEPKNHFRWIIPALALLGILLSARQSYGRGYHTWRDHAFSPVALAMLLWLFPQVWQNRRDDKFPIVVIGLAIVAAAFDFCQLVRGAF